MIFVTLRKSSLLLVLATFAVPAAARAGSKENKERAAKTACLSGDYTKGVALLAELYVSSNNDITYLFNQGRCFEQNGKYEEAIVRFREYQLKNADAGNAPDESAEKHIATCQAVLDKQKPAAQAAAVPVPASAASVASAPSVEPTESKASAVEAKPDARVEIAEAVAPVTPGRGLRIAGVTAAAVGVAGIATGVILNLKANSLAKDLEAANGSSTTLYSRSTESSRSSYQTLGWVGYGAGAACLVGGAVLYLLGHSQGQDAQVAFVPAVGAAPVGAALQGAF
jgi:tetratricopeptide (TPR) repeat protein